MKLLAPKKAYKGTYKGQAAKRAESMETHKL